MNTGKYITGSICTLVTIAMGIRMITKGLSKSDYFRLGIGIVAIIFAGIMIWGGVCIAIDQIKKSQKYQPAGSDS